MSVINIYKIAEMAGVSSATVSKVINGRYDVNEETRKKILQIIEENNFKPKLSSTNMDTIAIFAPISNSHISNPYFSSLLFGIGDIAYNYDFSIVIANTYKIPRNRNDFLKYCRQRKICGGIFALLTFDDNYLLNFADKFPMVSISHKFEKSSIASVQADNYTGGYEAVKHLIEFGHENILFIIPDVKHSDHVMRLMGGKKAIEEANLKFNNDIIENSLAVSDLDLSFYINKVIGQTDKPTAIFVASDQEALRVMRILQEKDIKVPDDISIIGFDDLSFAANTNPPLTTVNQPVYELGKEACRLLINLVTNENRTADADIMLKTKLMVRKSVKSLNDQK